MTARYTGPINQNRAIDRHARQSHPYGIWSGTTTASSTFTATGHTITAFFTATMGSEIISVPVQPAATDTVLDIDANLNMGATGGDIIVGFFYGTASHPFDSFLETYGASADRSSALSFASRYAVTGTATADIAMRLSNTAAITIFVNSNASGGSLGGLLKSTLRVTERRT